MTDCNLRFVVTNPIHMEAMKVRKKVPRKVRRENYLSSETTVKNSETSIQMKSVQP